MDRVPPDIFYDRAIVGAEGVRRHGHRGLSDERFFRAKDPLAGRPHFMVRAALRPWMFAAVLFGFGFFAVFVRQAQPFIQIILGAPIFEEMVKFGLALLISLALGGLVTAFRYPAWEHPGWLALRLPAALAVGAGFGVLEHELTYPGESLSSYVWRTLFHALATGTTMVAYQAALGASDVRARWLALLPAILVHYLNNYGALVLGIGSLVLSPLADIGQWLSIVLVVSLGVTAVAILGAPRATRGLLERLATRLPVETAKGA